MPHVTVKMLPGRTEAQKQALARAITEAVMTHAGCAETSVSVAIEDIQPDRWTPDVWVPDIEAKKETLYKHPGYKPA